jgi:hypothetical protein
MTVLQRVKSGWWAGRLSRQPSVAKDPFRWPMPVRTGRQACRHDRLARGSAACRRAASHRIDRPCGLAGDGLFKSLPLATRMIVEDLRRLEPDNSATTCCSAIYRRDPPAPEVLTARASRLPILRSRTGLSHRPPRSGCAPAAQQHEDKRPLSSRGAKVSSQTIRISSGPSRARSKASMRQSFGQHSWRNACEQAV